MYRIGLRLIGERPTGEPLATERNDDTGMVAVVHEGDDGLLVETYHDDVGLVTWYRATDVSDVQEWLGL